MLGEAKKLAFCVLSKCSEIQHTSTKNELEINLIFRETKVKSIIVLQSNGNLNNYGCSLKFENSVSQCQKSAKLKWKHFRMNIPL